MMNNTISILLLPGIISPDNKRSGGRGEPKLLLFVTYFIPTYFLALLKSLGFEKSQAFYLGEREQRGMHKTECLLA